MKKYTKKDLETFERDEDEYLICPSGDYSAIKDLPEKYTFGERCVFGDNHLFGKYSSFGEMCRFGDRNLFGDACRFGNGNGFGDRCVFGERCKFGMESIFGKRSIFIGKNQFGENCEFGLRCSHEGLINSIYVAVDRIGSNLGKTYFFKANEGYFVRAGCFFGTIDEFKTKVHKTHFGTIHETTYRMACELAVKLLDSQWK